MFSSRTVMEILPGCAIKSSKPFHLVFNSMGMDQVHYHRDTHAMGLINQFFQFFRGTEARRGSKKTGNMVAE